MPLAPSDDIVSLLTQDHEAIRQRLSEVCDAPPESRKELFWKLTDQLVRHEVAEELVVYPALRDLPGGREVASERQAEEAEAERLLASMENLDPGDDDFSRALAQLRENVLEHAHQEESEAFPLLLAHEEHAGLIYLAQKFKGAKLSAPNHPHPRLPSGSAAQKVLGPIASFFDRMRDEARSSA